MILFPEAFIPVHPRGLSFGTVMGSRSPAGRQAWLRYWANSVDVPGPTTEALGKAAREAGVYLAVGVIERDTQFSGGTLYCTLLYFGPDGQLRGKHRKLKPTADARDSWQATLYHIACEGPLLCAGLQSICHKSMDPADLEGREWR